MRIILAFVLTLFLFGCATDPHQIHVKPESQANYNRDLAKCDYEAKLAVRSPSTVSRRSVLAEYDMSLDRNDLAVDCMKAKGWTFSN